MDGSSRCVNVSEEGSGFELVSEEGSRFELVSEEGSGFELPTVAEPLSHASSGTQLQKRHSKRRYLFILQNCISLFSFLALFFILASLAANTSVFSIVFVVLLLVTLAKKVYALSLGFAVGTLVAQLSYALLCTVTGEDGSKM